jgi:ABC-type sugar transport system substrate-binding protein
VVVDSPLDAPCVIGRVGTENQIAATAGAKKAVAMAREIGWEKPSCVMIGGVEGDYNQESRLAGYRGGVMMSNGTWLAEVYPTDKSVDSARAAMEQIMKDYPEGLAVVACYNDLLAETALETAEANSAYDHTVFLGFDGNGSVCERIMNDDRYRNMVTVAQNPYEMGFAAVQMLSDYLRGQENASQAASIEGQGDSGGTASGDSDGDASGAAGGDSDGGAGGDTDGSASGDSDRDASGAAGGDTVGNDGSANYIDSGYSVITKVNAQERMVQIRNHLS